MSKRLTYLFISLLLAIPACAAIINVPDDHETILGGIDAAEEGDTVLVQPGEYVENIDFDGKNITVASLFLTTGEERYIEETVIDGNGDGRVVIFSNGETENAMLIGLSITNGYYAYGGGIYCNQSRPSIQYCSIIDNSANNGGGIACRNQSNLSLLGCSINNNIAIGEMYGGGGIYCDGNSNLEFIDCQINGNSHNNARRVSGVYVLSSSVLNFSDCEISDNSAEDIIYIRENEALEITNCVIRNNRGCVFMQGASSNITNTVFEENHGAIIIRGNGDYSFQNCDFLNNLGGSSMIEASTSANVTIDSCNFFNNSAVSGGIGVAIEIREGQSVISNCVFSGNTTLRQEFAGVVKFRQSHNAEIINCTIIGNFFEEGGGIIVSDGGAPTVTNCIIWGNEPNEVSFFPEGPGNSINISYSDIQDGEDGIETNDNGEINWGGGNIDSDPLFVNQDDNDFHLTEDSPCIDAGDPDGPRDPDGTLPDIGAYYFHQENAEFALIDVSPEIIDFDYVPIGISESINLVITNEGNAELTISEILVEGDFFDADFDDDITIEPDANYNVPITFAPMEVGDFEGALTIISNAVRNEELMVPLFGRGQFIIPLHNGWQIISSPVPPPDPDMEIVWEEIVERDNLYMVKDHVGWFYVPRLGFNNMDDWDVCRGYYARLNDADTLFIAGQPVEIDTPIPIEDVWSFVAYFPETPVPASDAFANIEDALLIAKDDSGRFYTVEFDFCNMPPLRRGKGYQVNISQPVELVWNVPEDMMLSGRTGINPYNGRTGIPACQDVDGLVHFAHPSVTGRNMSVLVVEDDPPLIPPYYTGVEIAAFTPGGLCVGVAALTGTTDRNVSSGNKTSPRMTDRNVCPPGCRVCPTGGRMWGMAVWGDDPTTEAVDGAVEGDPIMFKMWDGTREISLEPSWIEGDGMYSTDGFAVFDLSMESVIPTDFTIDYAYPNPFNSAVRIGYSMPSDDVVTIKIFDIAGRIVETLCNEHREAGRHIVTWDASRLPSGVYLCRMESCGRVRLAKLLLKI